ncbi:unnamed protein product, partial [Musa acuminata subsp. burmannicoides]
RTIRLLIAVAGGECLTFDQLALRAPFGQNTFNVIYRYSFGVQRMLGKL